jgi:hypothetical protein
MHEDHPRDDDVSDEEWWAWAAPLLRHAYGYTAGQMDAIEAFLDSVGDDEKAKEHEDGD